MLLSGGSKTSAFRRRTPDQTYPCVVQYAATGKGPLVNLGDHVLHPWSANFCTNGLSVPSVGLIK